jgi:hypothetical protein
MTFRSLYRLEKRGLLDCPIVGIAVGAWSNEELVTLAHRALSDTGKDRRGGVRMVDPVPGPLVNIAAHGEKEWRTVHLDTLFSNDLGEPPTPYERSLLEEDHRWQHPWLGDD